jgi:hypothetical protein
VLFAYQREELLADGQQRLARLRGIQRLDTGVATHHTVGALLDHRPEQPFLRPEVAVDGHLRDTGVRRDGVHAGALQAVRIEVVASRFQDAPAALGVAGAAPAWRRGRGIVVFLCHWFTYMDLTVHYISLHLLDT